MKFISVVCLLQAGGTPDEVEQIRQFADWLLSVGDGNVGGSNDGEVEFDFLGDILIRDATDPVAAIVDDTYPSLLDHVGDGAYFQDRAFSLLRTMLFSRLMTT